MDDGAGMGSTVADPVQAGPAGGSGGQADGADTGSGARDFRVGDRVVASKTKVPDMLGMSGTVSAVGNAAYPYPLRIDFDSGHEHFKDFPMNVGELEPEPVPYTLTKKAEEALTQGPYVEDPWTDWVANPPHYTQFSIEAIEVTEQFNFCIGNAIKYLWRTDAKGDPIENLEKAIWYIEREIARRTRG